MRSNFKIWTRLSIDSENLWMFAGFEGTVNNKCPRGDGIVDAFGSMI